MPLVLDPPTAKFDADGRGEPVILQLINYTERRFCFKIKSTNNDCYRVQPVYGFVDAGDRTPVELTRKRGAPGWDNFVVEWRGCSLNEHEPWAPFQRSDGRRGSSALDAKTRAEEKEVGQITMPVQVGAAGIIAQSSIRLGHDNATIIRDYATTATASWATEGQTRQSKPTVRVPHTGVIAGSLCHVES